MKTSFTFFYFVFAFCMSTTITAKAQAVNVTDSLALVDLYNSTNGPGWYYNGNWLTKKPVSTWYGITVTGTRVTQIYLYENYLSGSMPSSIGNLIKLTYLNLGDNQLSGSIPSSIGNLVKLQELSLYDDHQLGGSIPLSIGNLVNLIKLDLGFNQLSGSIPSSIGNLVKLTGLILNYNQLSDSIPSSIGNLIRLIKLDLGFNQLSGSIPFSIGNLVELNEVGFYYNQLSGSIPSSIGNLVNLIGLYLNNNQLTGSIPSPIGNLVNITYLNLSNNRLTGSLPASFQKLTFKYFDLSYNLLTESSNINVFHANYVRGNLNNNYFTFNGLESVAMHPIFPITYAPQAAINIHQSSDVLSVSAGGTLSNNTYKWFRTGSKDSTIIVGDSTFQPKQSGKYYAHINNSIATKLTLYTDTLKYTMPLAQSEINAVDTKTLNNHFSVYPNPAYNIIHITLHEMADVTITNEAGNCILTKSINNGGDIDVSNLAAGTYYIQNKTTGEVQKIVVMH